MNVAIPENPATPTYQEAVVVGLTGLEILQNRTRDQLCDLIEERLKAAGAELVAKALARSMSEGN